MQLHQTVAHTYKALKQPDKVNFYQNVHDLMSKAGSAFPTPTIAYTIGQTQITALKEAIQKALSKTKGTAAGTRDAVKAVEITMDKWAIYVDSIAEGSQAIIEAAGFDATLAESTPGSVTAQPVVSTVNPNVAGTMGFSFDKLPGTDISYNLIIATDLSMVTQAGNLITMVPIIGVSYFTASTRQTEISISGLPRYTRLYALCYTTNTAGNSVLSKIIEFGC